MLRLAGRKADGWLPSLGPLTPQELREGNKIVDGAAEAAGRDPHDVRRILNLQGVIGDHRSAGGVERLPVGHLSGEAPRRPTGLVGRYPRRLRRRRVRHRHLHADRAHDRPGGAVSPARSCRCCPAQRSDASRPSQASSQRRHASAQTRQCAWCSAWRSHSSRQARHATRQASTAARTRPRSEAVCLATTRPVASHTSAQSRHERMQRTISCRSLSPRLASAQLVQAAAHSPHPGRTALARRDRRWSAGNGPRASLESSRPLLCLRLQPRPVSAPAGWHIARDRPWSLA